MASIKVMHTADWQLGKPFGRFPSEVRVALSDARLDVIDRIGAVSVSSGSNHVLVAGDVFDNVEPGDRIVIQALSRMKALPVTWWLLPGNHDHARPGGLWTRVSNQAPSNVKVVDTAAPIEIEGGAWLLPAPLEHRRTRDDLTEAMMDMPTPPGALRIGLAHGSISEFGAVGESTNFIAPDRAQRAGLDYLALGDWHGFLTVGDRTAYSGTPEADRFGREEAGVCIAATVRGGEAPLLETVTTGKYRWLARAWDLNGADDFNRSLDALRGEGALANILVSLKLTGVVNLFERVAITALLDDQLAHELRHLDVDASSLSLRPTAEDVAQIEVQGALAGAVAALQALADTAGPDAGFAIAALERLYVEALKAEKEAAR